MEVGMEDKIAVEMVRRDFNVGAAVLNVLSNELSPVVILAFDLSRVGSR